MKQRQGTREILYLLGLSAVLQGTPGTAVLQPGLQDHGTIKDAVAKIVPMPQTTSGNIAVALIDDGLKIVKNLPRPLVGAARTVSLGEPVIMYGRDSVVVAGVIESASTTVEWFKGQVLLARLPAQLGDAGAPVLNANDELVGLLLGTWGRGDEKRAILLPVESVMRDLKALGMELVVADR